jgi:hypothetical protein
MRIGFWIVGMGRRRFGNWGLRYLFGYDGRVRDGVYPAEINVDLFQVVVLIHCLS